MPAAKTAVKTSPSRAPKKPAALPVAKAAAKAAAKTAAKTAKPAAKAPAARKPEAAAPKPAKVKARLVRDSFTMPQADFDLIAALKARAIEFKRPAKKSELLRAGLHALNALNDGTLRAALDTLAPLKPGRPKKDA